MILHVQSSELESIQELFELLQIKSDVWQSSGSEEAKSQSDDSSWERDHEPSDSVQIKRETDDDEKEEGEIKDDEDDPMEETSSQDQSNGSPNPVNLSISTKNNDKDETALDQDNQSEVFIIQFIIITIMVSSKCHRFSLWSKVELKSFILTRSTYRQPPFVWGENDYLFFKELFIFSQNFSFFLKNCLLFETIHTSS